MFIGGTNYTAYKQYEADYIKKWERIHKNAPVDLNWCKQDWDLRLSETQHVCSPEVYASAFEINLATKNA